MSTRGRRSCGDNVGLNPAMIHLLDVARLRRELESRGLDTKGNKLTLADRLEEAVRFGKSVVDGTSQQAEDTSPVMSAKRTPQQKSKKNNNEIKTPAASEGFSDENLYKTPTTTTRKRKAITDDSGKKTAPIKSLKIVWASEAPIDAIEKVEPITTAVSVSDTLSTASTPSRSKKKKRVEKKSVDITTSGDSVAEVATSVDSVATSGASAAEVATSGHSVAEITASGDSVESATTDMPISATPAAVVAKNKPMLVIDGSGDAPTAAAAQKSGELIVNSTLQPAAKSLPSLTTTTQKAAVPAVKPSSSTTATPSTTTATPTAAAVKKTSVAGRALQLPQRVTAGSVDLLDNIFSQQDQLLADKYKSDQEKALEKHLFELQKRRNSAAGGGATSMSPSAPSPAVTPLAATGKRLHRSVDGAEFDEYLPPVVGFNNRDPLNLRELEPLSVQTTFSSPQSTSSWTGGGGGHERYPPPNSAPIPSAATTSAGRFGASDLTLSEFPATRGERRATFSNAPSVRSPSTNALLLSPPPLPPATLIPPPPPPKPRSTPADESSIAAIVVPPPPPPRPNTTDRSELVGSAGPRADSSSPSLSLPTLIPPPPPPKIRPPTTVTKGEPISAIVVPPPPPKLEKRRPKSPVSEAPLAIQLTEATDVGTASPAPVEEVIVPPPPPPPVISLLPKSASPAPVSTAADQQEQPLTVDDAAGDENLLMLGQPKSPTSESAAIQPTDVADVVTAFPAPVEEVIVPPPPPPPVISAPSASVSAVIDQPEQPSTIDDAAGDENLLILCRPKSPVSEAPLAIQPTEVADVVMASPAPAEEMIVPPPPPPPVISLLPKSASPAPVSMAIDQQEQPSTVADVADAVETTNNVDSIMEEEITSVNDISADGEAAWPIVETEVFDEMQTTAGDETLNETTTSAVSDGEVLVKAEPNENGQNLVNNLITKRAATAYRIGDDFSVLLLKDPKALLRRATDVLKQINESENHGGSSVSHSRYDQLELDTTDYVMEEEEKPLPDFHGEPVPDDEDDDDILFEIAAGLRPPNKKRDAASTAAGDEPLPDDEFVELDYYNADMNVKASTNNKWLIDPDNQDGFALMWGGVKSNYGILVSDAFDVPSPDPIASAPNDSNVTAGGDGDEPIDASDKNNDVEDATAWPSCSQTSTATRAPRLLPKRVAYQIKIVEFLSLKHVPFEELEPHDVRIGWSAANTSNMLGESNQSYMFCSNARKANANVFTDYGDPFHVNDVITTVLDFEKHEIRYYKNGEKLGVAFSNVDFPVGTVVFPHIATKNCKVLVNFGYDDLPETENADDWNLPEEELPPPEDDEQKVTRRPTTTADDRELEVEEEYDGAVMIGLLQRRSGLLVASRRPPPDKAHCTVIAMVGLPGAGKTTWVKNYLMDHPEEHWVLFNTDTVLNAMTVNGVSRRRVHQGRWDMVMGLTAKAVNRSLQMACRRRHNYIIDQTNVSREARKKKLTQFAEFQRKCVVILPPDDELERRNLRQVRQEGSAGQIPVEAMLELKGALSIPCTETEPIEDVLFVEPPMEQLNEAIDLVKRYNEEGRPWIRKTHVTQKPESIISDCRNDTSNPWMAGQRSSRHNNSTF